MVIFKDNFNIEYFCGFFWIELNEDNVNMDLYDLIIGDIFLLIIDFEFFFLLYLILYFNLLLYIL